MGYVGINLGSVKLNNRSMILRLLNDQGAMSRKDMAQRLGLTPATLSLICAEMLEDGLLLEKGQLTEEKRAGRKKVLIDINREFRLALTIRIEESITTITVCDLYGRSLGVKKISTEKESEAKDFLERIAVECKSILWENHVDKAKLLGVGVSVPGPVDRENGISLHAVNIWDEPAAVKEILEKEIGLPVAVENNIRAYAEAELLFGKGKTADNMLLIKWGPGVDSAVIVDNRILKMPDSHIAGLGHTIVDPKGESCTCGRQGCLETRVSAQAIADIVRKNCTSETMPELYQRLEGDMTRIDAYSIGEWIETEDELLRKLMEDVIEQLAAAVVNAMTMMSPDKVIVYGFMFDLPQVFEKFAAYCSGIDADYDAEFIQRSALREAADHVGALALVYNEMFLK